MPKRSEATPANPSLPRRSFVSGAQKTSSLERPHAWRPGPGSGAGEREQIATLRRRVERQASRTDRSSALRLGIGDDCAILRPSSGDEIVVTTDLFLEQVHFRRDWHPPEAAGHRCLARGLSDIAAMGATPAAAFLSFALPPELSGDWRRRFLAGLLRLADLHDVPLAGGDTAQAPALPGQRRRAGASASPATARRVHPGESKQAYPGSGALFTADIVLLGTLPRGKALLRSGAKPGDAIYVTGALGGAAAELARLQKTPQAYAGLQQDRAGHPHLFPQPRLAAGRFLLGRASAAIDLSDGLSTDLAHLCEESDVAAEVEARLLPIHALAALGSAALGLALHGGEDYELLFTAAARRRLPVEMEGVPISRIGTILEAKRGRPRVALLLPDGRRSPLRNQGWEHFKD